jgi:phytoene dehydrogenase-like protein
VSRQGYDVAVVGAGIGGLGAASLLARAGRSVILLDRASGTGGVCQPLVHDGYRFEVGPTLLTGFGPGGPLRLLCQRLDINLPIKTCDPAMQVALPHHRLSFWAEPEGWWREIRREFPGDEAGWRALWTELTDLVQARERALQELPELPPEGWGDRLRVWRVLTLGTVSPSPAQSGAGGAGLKRALATPFHATLNRHRLGEGSRRALEAAVWFLALRDASECSTLEAAMLLHQARHGTVAVSGGVAALVVALTEQFQKDGGQLRLGTPIARLHLEGGRVRGVITSAGETIRARWVVANVPPGVLTGSLLPSRRRWLKGKSVVDGPWEPTITAEMMVAAVPEALLPSELSGLCFVVRDPHRPAREENLVFVRTTPAWDEGQGPGGLRCLSLGRLVRTRFGSEEAAVERDLLEAVDQLIPGVTGAMAYRQILTPATLAKVWGRPAAAVQYGVKTPDWLGQRGLPHRLGWPGLLAVGDWTYPGRLVAQVVEGAMRVADLIQTEM